MKTIKYTPKVALRQRALGGIVRETANLLAEQFKKEGEEIPADTIRADLWEFCVLSTRTEFDEGEVDFDPATASETAESLAIKYVVYLASEQSKCIQEAWRAIFAQDADVPSDPATSPSKPEDDHPGKS